MAVGGHMSLQATEWLATVAMRPVRQESDPVPAGGGAGGGLGGGGGAPAGGRARRPAEHADRALHELRHPLLPPDVLGCAQARGSPNDERAELPQGLQLVYERGRLVSTKPTLVTYGISSSNQKSRV